MATHSADTAFAFRRRRSPQQPRQEDAGVDVARACGVNGRHRRGGHNYRRGLERHPDAHTAVEAAGVEETQRPAYLRALAGLAANGTIEKRHEKRERL